MEASMSGHQRPRPEQLLKPYFLEHPSYEGWQLQQKYSNPAATIGEHSLDYIFFTLMNEDALLYWLPRLFTYLQTEARLDTYHFDVVMFNLAKKEVSDALRARASEEERDTFYKFLLWVDKNTDLSTGTPMGVQEYQVALKCWAP